MERLWQDKRILLGQSLHHPLHFLAQNGHLLGQRILLPTGLRQGRLPSQFRIARSVAAWSAAPGAVTWLAAAFGFIRDPANRDRVVETIVETTGVSKLIAGQTLDLFFHPERGVLPRHGEIELKGLEEVIALMNEAGNLKAPLPSADRFVDTQYLKAAGAQ